MLEGIPLLERQGIRLGDDRDNVDDLAELLHDNDINRAEGVARRVDEEEGTVDTGVLDVTVALRGELLAKVGAVLVLDVLDNRIPATRHMEDVSGRCCGGLKTHREEGKAVGESADVPVFVVHVVAVPGGVDDVQAQPNTILNNDWGHVEAMSVTPEPKDAP